MSLLSQLTALATFLLGGSVLAEPSGETRLRYYHCDFTPGVEFFVADTPLLPAYRCVSGRVQLLLASQDFRAPYSNTEWIEELDVQLPDDLLTQVFPGSFHYVRHSVHRPAHGLQFQNPNVAVNGVQVLNARRADLVDTW